MNKKHLINVILCYCPSLADRKQHDPKGFEHAVTSMTIAHQYNGGHYIGFYETAVQYLKSLERGSSNVTNN